MSIKWNPCNESMTHQLSGITFIPGNVYPYPNDALPDSIQKSMPGLKETFVSGYLTAKPTEYSGLSGFGEFAVIREDGPLNKSYNFVFALDDKGQFYFAGPYKYFDGHHSLSGVPVSINKIFGNTPLS